MYRNALSILVALACASGALAQFERCHTNIMTPHHFLNMEKFLGVWYPLEVHFSKSHQAIRPTYACLENNITFTGTEDHYHMTEAARPLQNGEIGPIFSNDLIVINGMSTGFTPMPLPSKWVVAYNGDPVAQSAIIASDESSWALQYICVHEGYDAEGVSIINEQMTLLSRQRFIDQTTRDVLKKVIFSIGFPYANGFNIVQSGCNA